MNRESDERIKKTLRKNHSCYVLITCDESSEEGVMQVEMSFEGDPIVASYLLQGAQTMMDEQESMHDDDSDYLDKDPSTNKIESLHG